jgi:hypothetical protein
MVEAIRHGLNRPGVTRRGVDHPWSVGGAPRAEGNRGFLGSREEKSDRAGPV